MTCGGARQPHGVPGSVQMLPSLMKGSVVAHSHKAAAPIPPI